VNKIAFISDIHGNIEALTAILAKIKESACDKIYCLGDIVGYGPNPDECISLIRELEIESVMGNHDEYVTLLMDPRVERLREEVREAIYWTQGHLSMDDLRWLSNRPMRIVTEHFTCLHGSFIPQPWGYCLDEKTFAANFQYQDVSLAFCGHSHSPLVGINIPGEMPHVDFIRRKVLELTEKTMVNVGSVGQPRDSDPRACAVTYEPETRCLDIIRADYDYAATQAKIRERGLPERFASRLPLGR